MTADRDRLESGPGSTPADLDVIISSGLRGSVDGVGRVQPGELAARLRELDSRSGRQGRGSVTTAPADRRRGRYVGIAVAASILMAAAGIGIWLTNDGGNSELDVVSEEPPPPPVGPFDGYATGWHEIDTSPLPSLEAVTMAFVDTELVVAGARTDGSGSGTDLFAYDVVERTWRELPDPHLTGAQIVGTGGAVVAVAAAQGASPGAAVAGQWSVLEGFDEGTPAWSEPSEVPIAPGLASAGALGPRTPTGFLNLLWTGNRVVDMTHGAVLDPSTGSSEPLEMPDDLVKYTHLLSSNAVWTGREVVLAAYSDGGALRWDADGGLLGPIEGSLPPGGSTGTYVREATAIADNGRVLLFDREGTGSAIALDPGSGAWTQLPDLPTDPAATYCPTLASSVGTPVVEACSGDGSMGSLVAFVDGNWAGTDPPPQTSGPCCAGQWLGIEGALFTWVPDTEDPPGSAGLSLWIPSESADAAVRGAPGQPVPPGQSGMDPSCPVELLADLGPMLPGELRDGPEPGRGGMPDSEPNSEPDSEDMCARHWSAGEDSGVHVTQSVGGLGHGLTDASASGEFRWGIIEDGFGIEFTGEPAWSASAYGIGEADFSRLVEELLVETDRSGPTQLREVRADTTGPTTGSAIGSVSAASPGGDPIISIEFEEHPSIYVSAQQSPDASTTECQPAPTGAPWYLTVQLTSASLASGEGSPYSNVGLDGAGLSEVLGSATACNAGGTVVLVFGLDGSHPITIHSDDAAGLITIDLSR